MSAPADKLNQLIIMKIPYERTAVPERSAAVSSLRDQPQDSRPERDFVPLCGISRSSLAFSKTPELLARARRLIWRQSRSLLAGLLLSVVVPTTADTLSTNVVTLAWDYPESELCPQLTFRL